ncbi:MAG: GGDEF domain-containing protein [Kofleriaceae bacterium]
MPTLLLSSPFDTDARAHHIEGTTDLALYGLEGVLELRDGRYFLGDRELANGTHVRGGTLYANDDIARVLATDRYRRLTYDGLTGTLNRRYLESHLSRIAPSNVVMAVDLDRLKQINDYYGLPVGDQALRNVARVLRSALHPNELVSRIGGEEFVAIGAFTRERAEAIRLACAHPFTRSDDATELTATVSIAIFSPVPANLYDLMQLVEQRMAIAKRTRNCVVVT